MKKLLSFLITMSIMLGMFPSIPVSATGETTWDGVAAESFEDGSGTKANPYKITSAAELKLAADMVNDTTVTDDQWTRTIYFKLMNDIDYEDHEWTPIGMSNQNSSYTFRGGFDGNTCVVKNLTIALEDNEDGTVVFPRYCGFFGYAQNAEIKDLGIENIKIVLKNPSASSRRALYIGAFAGKLTGSTVSRCYVKNSTVKPSTNVESDGVAGFVHTTAANNSGTATSITDCYVYNVTLKSGYNRSQCGFTAVTSGNTAFTNCYVNGTAEGSGTARPVYAFGYVGGNVESATKTPYTEGTTATVSNCLSTMTDANGVTTSSFGTGGKTVSEIDATFKELANWSSDETKNDGLPILAWELLPEPTPTPTPTPTATPDPNSTEPPEINLVLMGDSLMDKNSTNADNPNFPKTGWGGKISNFIKSDKITLVHHGHDGQRVDHFINGRQLSHYCSWENIKNEFGEGDYVIIALGTNDKKQIDAYNKDMEDGTRDTDDGYSAEQFKTWYKQIIEDTRNKGAKIIVLTPPPNTWSTTSGRFIGTDEWSSSAALLDLEEEVDNLTVINIGEAYAATLNAYMSATGYTAAQLQMDYSNNTITAPGIIFVDHVHFSEIGADLLAWTVANEIAKTTTGLEKYMVPGSMPTATPAPTSTPTATATASPSTTPTATATASPSTSPTETADPEAGWNGTPATSFAVGDGSPGNPYLISDAAELALAAAKVNDGTAKTAHFKLMADIDCNAQTWTPIGNSTNKFQGFFDGNYKTISNFKIEGDASSTYEAMGLFGYVGDNEAGTTIRNLGVEDITIKFTGSTTKYLGGMAGNVYAYTTIENCYVKNSSLEFNSNYGGGNPLNIGSFIGRIGANSSTEASAPVVKNCYTYGMTLRTARDRILGGFVGAVDGTYPGEFSNCYVANVSFPSGYEKSSADSGIKSTLYAFVNSSGKANLSLPNCYSTLTGGVGNETGYQAFTSANNVGEKDKTAADIRTAFEGVAEFGLSANENNGEYPCLKYEDPTLGAMPTPIPTPTPVPTPTPTPTPVPTPTPKPTPTPLESKVTFGEFETAVNEEDGTMTASLDFTYEELTYSKIKFMVVKTNADGDILDIEEDEQNVSESGTGTQSFSVTFDTQLGTGEELKWYLWGDDNVSLIDNAPTKITDLTATSKITGIRLNWAQSYDDSGKPVKYKIYRVGQQTAQTTTEITRLMSGSTSTAYQYIVKPVDANGNIGTDATSEAVNSMRKYSSNANGTEYGLTYTKGNDTQDAYSAIWTREDGIKVFTCDKSPLELPGNSNGNPYPRFIYFKTASPWDNAKDAANLTFEIRYLDIGTGDLTLRYNRIPTGTETDDTYNATNARKVIATLTNSGEWKTATFNITDAKLRNSSVSSNCSFGIVVPSSSAACAIQIQYINVYRTEDYE